MKIYMYILLNLAHLYYSWVSLLYIVLSSFFFTLGLRTPPRSPFLRAGSQLIFLTMTLVVRCLPLSMGVWVGVRWELRWVCSPGQAILLQRQTILRRLV